MKAEDSLVLVDMDQTAWGFEEAFIEAWQRRHPDLPFVPLQERRRFKIEDDYPDRHRALVRAIKLAPGFALSMRPLPGAIEAVRQMSCGGLSVFFCTAALSNCPHNLSEKQSVIERDCPEFAGRLIVTKDKTLVRGRWLFDDRPSVAGLMTPTWEHVVVGAPYNRHVTGRRRVRSLADWREVTNR